MGGGEVGIWVGGGDVAFHLVLALTAYNLGKFRVVLNSVFLKIFGVLARNSKHT